MSVRRPELVLAGALALCAPMIPGVLDNNITIVTAGTRLLVAIIACWCAGSMLTKLIDRYSREARRTQTIKMLTASRLALGPGPAMPKPSSGNEVDW